MSDVMILVILAVQCTFDAVRGLTHESRVAEGAALHGCSSP
jgi:hypothetical protein